MRKNIGIAKFLAVLLVLFGNIWAALAVDSYTVTPSVLRPGEEGAITFSVRNVLPAGSTSTISPLENVQVFFSASEGIVFRAQSPFVIGTIESGGSALVSVPFRVLPNAKGGTTTASFFISQKDKSDLKTVNAIIKIVNPPIITLTSDRQSLLSTDVINLTITNNGGKAERTTLAIAEGSGFALMGTSEIYLGDVSGTMNIKVPLDSRNVKEGLNSIPFVLTYQQEGGQAASETKYLSVVVKKEKADVIFEQSEKITTAQEDVLKLKVKNIGRALEDFKFYLEDEYIKAKENKLVRLGNLKSGEEKEIMIAVSVDATPGVRNADVTLKWIEDDVEKEERTKVPIFVESDSDVAIFLDAKPTPIIAGGEHTLSVLVSNIGSYKIYNVEVNLPQNEVLELYNAQNSQYIGGLDSDDFSTVQYKIKVRKEEPGVYEVPINVRYKDKSGSWIEKNQSLKIVVRSAAEISKKENGNAAWLAAGALVVVGALAYWYFKIRKKGRASPKI
ncbi:MAG: hypothetical protein N3G22_02755 [Candidatus Micrarchaeota archaeon]|nr:hypothetical protein [Candidatus Micrarchaeota archaeon]